MKAMVLAAGYGKRLRPLTVYRAKPALPLLGTPLVEYTLAMLARAGVRELVVNLHHLPETIRSVLQGRKADELRIHYSYESCILGTAGGLKQAEPILGDGTFFLVNGDTLLDSDLAGLVEFHRARGAEATLLLCRRPTGSWYTGIRVNEDGRLVSMGNEASANWMFAGVWVLEPSVFDRLPAGEPGGLEVKLLPDLIQRRTAFGCVQDVAWFDIGTPRNYLRACLYMSRHGTFRESWKAVRIELPAGSSPDAVVVAGPGTFVDPSARFDGDAVIGSNCRVAGGTIIQRSVLWDGVLVEQGAIVRNSVATDHVRLSPESRWEDKVILRAGADRVGVRAREIRDEYVVADIKR